MPYEPPENFRRMTTIDAHAAGEPLRVITSGFPEPPGETILQKRQYASEHCDDLRRALMFEPRGHANMYGCLPTAPVTPDGDLGVLFMHNEGFSTMCGHGIIALTTVAIETGMIAASGDEQVIRYDTPAGRVTATAHLRDGRVRKVSFINVPSFLLARDLEVSVPDLGVVRCDIAFGGAFYAYVDAEPLGLDLVPANHARIIDIAMRIKRAVMQSYEIVHPDGSGDLNFLYGTILVQPASDPLHSRNVCVFADGEVDRSPTGTGVSGRAAIHHARGELAVGQTITIESLIGTSFDVRAVETTTVGGRPAIIPEVTGSSYLTGRHEFLIDPDDPLRGGVLLR
ncbi:MAG: proline racemase family protein [Phycisphaerales bacterium]|nr:MAG: proline racemase family protein [Phycisphaerales bacterium]